MNPLQEINEKKLALAQAECRVYGHRTFRHVTEMGQSWPTALICDCGKSINTDADLVEYGHVTADGTIAPFPNRSLTPGQTIYVRATLQENQQ